MAAWLRKLLSKSEAEHADCVGWLYDRYASSVYRLAVFITGCADDAEDAVADVFARLSARRGSLKADADPRAYLLSAVRNASYSILRRRRRHVELSDSALHYLSLAQYDATLDAGIEAAEVMKALARLPADQREVVVLKTLEQLTFNEIAQLTGESINTVAGRYRRAIVSLRRASKDDENG